MKDVQKLMRAVYYFDGKLYYQIQSCYKYKLYKKNKLRNFIVLDVTKNIIMSKDEFLKEYFINNINYKPEDVINFLDTLRFKVYKKIKSLRKNK